MSKNQYHDSEVLYKNNIQCCFVNPSIKLCKLSPKDNSFKNLNYSNVKTEIKCTRSEFNDIDKSITIDVDSLYDDHTIYDCNNKMNISPESKIFKTLNNKDISDERLDEVKSISSLETISMSSKDIESKSFSKLYIKASSSITIPKLNNVVDTIDTIQFDTSCRDQNKIIDTSDIKKVYEILDDDDSVSHFISQSISKTINSQNLEKASTKSVTTNLSINNMGDTAVYTHLAQKTIIYDVLKILRKSLDTCPLSDVLMEDPKGLVVSLMPHQKYAVAWLMWKESQTPFGGILADDMGLGKTLSMISLVLKSKEKETSVSVVSKNSSENNFVSGGTLIVCPASLLNQWKNEMRTKLSPGLLKVGQYYGLKRSGVSSSELAENDIVTTSYNIVMWDFKKQQNTSPLFKINWKRIILDEAHVIRNHKTQTCFAVCNITSICRWAITGTPIHNKEADFFTLLKFIRCKPFNNWTIWKQWVGNNNDSGRHRQSLLVKALMLRRTKEELSQLTPFKLPGKNVSTIEIELSKEERNVYEQLLKFSSKFFATYLYDKAAKERVFDHNVEVQCTVQCLLEQIKKKEETFKDHPELQKLFMQFINIKEVQTYHILVLLLRLRQMCCHPCLIKGKITEEKINDEKNHILDCENITDNDVIHNNLRNENFNIAPTKDLNFVEELIMSDLTLDESKFNQENKQIDNNLIFEKSWLSSKIKAVCSMVREKVLIDDCKEKAIIVSQWPSMLRIIRYHLSEYNCEMEMYSGNLSILKRNEIIREFNNINGGPQILLLSLMAGGVGLNLMAANHMFLVDVHWNPQLEAQVCDRIHRLGQIRPVNIYKFICKNTIETKILMIQLHKLEIAQTLFEGVKISSSKITLNDLKHIFNVPE